MRINALLFACTLIVLLIYSPAGGGMVCAPAAAEEPPRVDIESVYRGSIPGKYVIVNANIRFENRSDQEIVINNGDILLVDADGTVYPADIYGYSGQIIGYDQTGNPIYAYPQPVPMVYLIRGATMMVRATFYLPLGKTPDTVIVRYRGREIARSPVI